jgi:hypothetical protein
VICKGPLSAPLDQHHMAQIEVFIVFTERLVSIRCLSSNIVHGTTLCP